jgi:hypothetical protein
MVWSQTFFTLVVVLICFSSTNAYRLRTARPRTYQKLFGRAERRMKKQDKRTDTGVSVSQGVDVGESVKGFGSAASETLVGSEGVGDGAPLESLISKDSVGDDPEADLDSIFKKYGIEENKGKGFGAPHPQHQKQKQQVSSSSAGGEQPFGKAVLDKVDEKLQAKIDKGLITLTFLSLAFCVLCGLAISSSAIEVVFPQYKMGESVDFILKDVLTPAFTPSIGIFFFFSITFGIFKFAQISSNATVYRENNTDL